MSATHLVPHFLRDQVFCDLDTTDVCLFKNRNVDFAK